MAEASLDNPFDDPPSPGHNAPPKDYAADAQAEMADKHFTLANSITALLEQARGLKETVENETDVNAYSLVAVALRDASARAEATRVTEKEPYLRGGQGVDSFFKNLTTRANKGFEVLSARVNAYKQRQLADERAKRERERQEAERLAREAQQKAEAEEAARREAEAAAARARKAENIKAHEEEAERRRIEAEAARKAAHDAAVEAENARLETLRKPADLVRERTEGGHTVTMKQIPHVEITDREKLDKDKLWPFIKDDHLLMALKAWAKTTSHRGTMEGALIEMRNSTEIL